MALVLLIGLGMAWIVHRARVQRQAVAAITQGGGTVRYDWQFLPNGRRNPNGQPAYPGWLVRRLGVDYFGNVVVVYLGPGDVDPIMAHVGRLDRLKHLHALGGAKMTDAGLAHVRRLFRMEDLSLDEKGITGAGLVHMEHLSYLKTLSLPFGTPVADADLAALEGLTSLSSLNLMDSGITDVGLAHLRGLTEMRMLGLDGSKITGAGLAHLAAMSKLHTLQLYKTQVDDLTPLGVKPGLTRLDLRSTPITEAGLGAVANLPNLTNIDLNGTKVTDAGLAHLGRLPHLGVLRLAKTRVTDAGLAHISGLPALETLDLDSTSVTDAGLASLPVFARGGELSLVHTRITDAGLARLARLGLSVLSIRSTLTTESGIAAFRKASPGTRVVSGPLSRGVVRDR